MSLINKMLQDLDARGGAQGGVATRLNIQPVLRDERRTPLMLAGGVLLLMALAAGGYFGWRALQRARPAAAAPVALVPVKTVLLAPAPPLVSVAPAAPAEAMPAAPAPVVPAPRAAAARAALTATEEPAEKPPLAAPRKIGAAKAAKPASAVDAVAPAANGRTLTAQQRAETEYRRALASLQEGRSGETIAALEQALQIEPRHEAARQTLVSLLLENKRPDEAMRQLQQALDAEPRQPAMATLLARLQIERGGSGVDTLLRTLPYASGNAEFHAFLAGALQRQQRHREAAEQYQAALRGVPHNGVWLVGLGISLQAEKRNAETLDAFQQARSSASLSPELQAFVDRKLQQLSH
jgi:MSHA biogenesis protein MshN